MRFVLLQAVDILLLTVNVVCIKRVAGQLDLNRRINSVQIGLNPNYVGKLNIRKSKKLIGCPPCPVESAVGQRYRRAGTTGTRPVT